tara:strand:+ start:4899 stop:5327 length:429 start_codon:yes stop_codon:yes gene_type:complete
MNKILLGVSVAANLVLIATVVGIMPLFLALAAIVITILCWYIKKLTAELKTISNDFDDFYSKLDKYENHLNEIHGMEMFYGDETLQGLIKHSRGMINDIYDFQEKYFLEKEDNFDRTETSTENPEEEEKESLLHRDPPTSDS